VEKTNAIEQKLSTKFGARIKEAKVQRARRLWITVDRADSKELIAFAVKELGFTYLSTITANDLGDHYEVLYHLTNGHVVLTVKVPVPKDEFEPKIDSIVSVIPGAIFYEREIADMMGIRAEGHPSLIRFSLPDCHPDGDHPLRKDWKPIDKEQDACWRG
jgi:Ni,Fe-hydrogenase III component G